MSRIEGCYNDYHRPHRHIAIIHKPEPGDAVFADFSGALAITVRDKVGCVKSIAMVYLDMFDWDSKGAYAEGKEQFRAKDFQARTQYRASLVADRKKVDTTRATRQMIEALGALEEGTGDSVQICYIYQKPQAAFFSENDSLGMMQHCEKLKKYLETEISTAHSNINCTPVFLRLPSLGKFALDSRGRLVTIASLSPPKKILDCAKEKATRISTSTPEREWVLGEELGNGFFLAGVSLRVKEMKPREAAGLALLEPQSPKVGCSFG